MTANKPDVRSLGAVGQPPTAEVVWPTFSPGTGDAILTPRWKVRFGEPTRDNPLRSTTGWEVLGQSLRMRRAQAIISGDSLTVRQAGCPGRGQHH